MSRKQPMWKKRKQTIPKYYCMNCGVYHTMKSKTGKEHHYSGKRYLKKKSINNDDYDSWMDDIIYD